MNLSKSILLSVAVFCTILSIQSCSDDCDDIICENGGTCDDGICDCPDGFSGTNCEIQDLCFGIICNNGGTCIDGSCDCLDGYTGANCEIFDASQAQALLANHSPLELVNGGVAIDSLYGKMYAGGLIFYVDVNNELENIEGMVAAITNHSTEPVWGCFGTDIVNLSNVMGCPDDCIYPEPMDTFIGARIGDGIMNTDAILAECNEDGIAAKICRDYRGGNHDDWFLPARGELYLMFSNLYAKGHAEVQNNIYMSSTEATSDIVYSLSFNTLENGGGNYIYVEKNPGWPIWAVRAF